MAEADGGRSLSDLSDDLLRHVLFFAPAREGASTAVLSRRWRWLWRTSGAVNLDSRSWKQRRSSDEPSNRKRSRGSISNSAVFLRGAKKALAAAQDPIRKLTFFVAEDSEIDLMETTRSGASNRRMIETLVSNPAARFIEELRIEVKPRNFQWTLSLASLPSEALRVLRIVNCTTLTAAPPPSAAAAAFPRLADLHLHGCSVDIEDLRSTIAAAPQLSTLHLQSLYLFPVLDKTFVYEMQIDSVCCPLRCPAVTALVFADCRFAPAYYRRHGRSSLEIDPFVKEERLEIDLDVPMLQYFRYEGSVFDLTSRLRLKGHASNNMVQQVDLSLTYRRHYSDPGRQICELFWRFVQRFNTTRRLRIKMDMLMDDLVVADKTTKDVLLGSLSFYRLEELELEGKYMPGFEISIALLADLLHSCPVVRDLRFKFSKIELEEAPIWSSKKEADDGVLGMLQRQIPSVRKWILANSGKKLDKAVGHAMDIKLQHDDNYQVYGIPGLAGEHTFSCLQSYLKRVSLDFCMDEPTCLGFKLAKFFAENAMVLQEMHVDDCGPEMLEHLDPSVRRLMAAEHR